MVKFSSTLFIMYFSGRCFSLWMKLIMYSHMGERWMRYTKRPFSNLAYSVSTFSTTCLPNEHTLVEHVMVMFSLLSYLQEAEPIYSLGGKVKLHQFPWCILDQNKESTILGSRCKQLICRTLNFVLWTKFCNRRALSTRCSRMLHRAVSEMPIDISEVLAASLMMEAVSTSEMSVYTAQHHF